MALSDYNVLANVCQRMKNWCKTLAYVEVERKKSEKSLSWTNAQRMHNAMNVCVTYVQRMGNLNITYLWRIIAYASVCSAYL